MSSRNAAFSERPTIVRPARAGEAASLTALCLRSKAHWGYDAGFMGLCVPSLTVSDARLRRMKSSS